MKYIALFFIIMGLLIGCRQEEEMPLPNIFPELLILDISFPGIPKEHVRIDQPNRKIYVKMPALLTTNNLKPIISLSEKSRLALEYDIEKIAQPGNWCFPESEGILSIRLAKKTRTDKGWDVTYTIHPVANAPLSIIQSTPLLDFEIGESINIHLDALNLYGNSMPQTVIFTHTKTTKQILVQNVDLVTGLYYVNNASIYAYWVPFEPGEYNIKIKQRDGSLIEVLPTLTTIPGKSRIEDQITSLGRLRSLSGKTLTLSGRNLFSGLVEFRLLFPNGTFVPLKAAFSDNGNETQIDLPSNLLVGAYGIEIVREGRPVGISYRLGVVAKENQLFLGALNKLPGRQYPTDSPLVLARNKPIPVSFGPVDGKLDNYIFALIDPITAAVTRFPLTWPIEADPYFTIPASMPPGHYKAVMLEIDPVTQKAVRESESFERIVILD